MVDRAVIEAIRERIDIVEVISQVVTLKRRGSSMMGLCPFHDEKSPSFSVVAHKGIYHCFGCSESGDVFKFVQQTRGLGFMETVRELGAACGVAVEERELSPDERRKMRARADLHDVCEAAAQFFHGVLMTRPEGKVARDYLSDRGITRDTISKYRLGYAPDHWSALLDHLHREGLPVELALQAGLARPRREGSGAYDLFRARLQIPIFDGRGRVVAFGGRILGGQTRTAGPEAPKYVNSPETPVYQKSKVLYGLWHARAAIQRRDRLVVVEGYFDVLSLHQAGFQEAVATCGTALTPEHLRTVQRLTRTVVAQFDEDEAGMRAATRSLELFLSAAIEPRRLDLGAHKDPDEYIQAEGAEAFEALLARGEPLLDLVIRRSVARHGRSPDAAQRIIDELAPMVRHAEAGSARRLAIVQRVGAAIGQHEQVVEERIGRAARPEVGGPEVARWRGNADLNHLLLLLIHFPDEVRPVLAEVDPAVVGGRETLREAIGLLMQGRALPEVIDDVDDADLARVLHAAAARGELYTAEQAGSAMAEILGRMQLNRISAELAEVKRAIDTCTLADDRSRVLELYRRRQHLQKRRQTLLRTKRQPGLG